MNFLKKIFGKAKIDETWQLDFATELEGGNVRFFWKNHKGEKHDFSFEPDLTTLSMEGVVARAAITKLQSEDLVSVNGELSFKNLASLESREREFIGFSESSGWSATISPTAVIGKREPNISMYWTAPDGDYLGKTAERFVPIACGFLEKKTNEIHVLPTDVLKLRDSISAGQKRFDSVAEEFRFLADVQELTTQVNKEDHFNSAFELEPQLEKEKYIVPKKEDVDIDIRQTEDGGIEIRPVFDGFDTFGDSDELVEEEVRGYYIRGMENPIGRERIILEPETIDQINAIKKARFITKDETREFVSNPRKFLEEKMGGAVVDAMELDSVAERLEAFDIQAFGDRVVGLGEIEKVDNFSSDGLMGSDWFDVDSEIQLPEVEEENNLNNAKPVIVLETADNRDAQEFEAQSHQVLQDDFKTYGTPNLFDGKLYDHQKAGYVWLRKLWAAVETGNSIGGLLADDMGLGKTIQVAALFAYLYEHGKLSPTLIVAPTTVVENWTAELKKFLKPDLKVICHLGQSRARTVERLNGADIILTSYTTMGNDQFLLGQIEFQVLVLDEAQRIKNYTTKRASAARAMNAKLRLPLTATPVENRLTELWAIMDFAQPGLLGTLRSFTQNYVTPIDEGQNQAAGDLIRKMDVHYIRRTKENTLKDLPEKKVLHLELPMPDFQRDVYQRLLQYHQRRGRKGILPSIQSLLLVCGHPLALPSEMFERIGVSSELPDVDTIISTSAKFAYVMEQLTHVQLVQEKAILFTTRPAVQSLLHSVLQQKFGIDAPIIGGQTPQGRRGKIVKSFQESSGFNVIILSTIAAGVGINVTAANHVFHVTRTWNPATENQATDRAYRIGQKREVTVHVPYVSYPGFTCLDVRLNDLMNAKQSLVEQVIRPTQNSAVSWRELEECFDQKIGITNERDNVQNDKIERNNLHPEASRLLEDVRFTDAARRCHLPLDDAAKITSFLFRTPSSKQKLCRVFSWDEDLLMSKLAKLGRVFLETDIGNIGLIENVLSIELKHG